MAKGIMLYRSTETIQMQNITCIPCEAFLENLKPNVAIVT